MEMVAVLLTLSSGQQLYMKPQSAWILQLLGI